MLNIEEMEDRYELFMVERQVVPQRGRQHSRRRSDTRTQTKTVKEHSHEEL